MVQRQVLRTVFLDVVADSNEFFRVFFLLIGSHVERVPLSGILPADQNQHGDQLGIDGGADQNGGAEIFPADVQHQLFEPFVDTGGGVRRQKKRLRDGGEGGLDIRHIVKQGKINLQDQPFSVNGTGHTVDNAGVDEENIAFLQDEELFFGGHFVGIFDGHDDLNGRVPVFRVGFVIGVVVEQKTGHFLVDHGFLDAVEYFNHKSYPFFLMDGLYFCGLYGKKVTD